MSRSQTHILHPWVCRRHGFRRAFAFTYERARTHAHSTVAKINREIRVHFELSVFVLKMALLLSWLTPLLNLGHSMYTWLSRAYYHNVHTVMIKTEFTYVIIPFQFSCYTCCDADLITWCTHVFSISQKSLDFHFKAIYTHGEVIFYFLLANEWAAACLVVTAWWD